MRLPFLVAVFLCIFVAGFGDTNSPFSHDVVFRPAFRTTRLLGPEVDADFFYTFTFFRNFHAHAATGFDIGRFHFYAYRLGFSVSLDEPDIGLSAGIYFVNQGFPQYGKAYNSFAPGVNLRLWGFRLHGGICLNNLVTDTNNLWNIFYYSTPMFQVSYELGIAYHLEFFDNRYILEFGFNNYEPLRVIYYSAFGLHVDQKYRWNEWLSFVLYTGVRMTGSLDLSAQISEFSCRAGAEVEL